MDIGAAIGFVFEDKEWTNKLLVAAVISLVPVFGGIAVTGYAIAVLRNVAARESRPLPGWDDVGRTFVDGLTFWIATLIYAVPLLILLCPIAVVWLLPAFAGDSQETTALLAGLAGVVSAGLGCLALLYGLLLWVLTPVLQIRYAEGRNLAACLRFGEVFRLLFDNIGPIIAAQLLVWAGGFALTTIFGGVIGTIGLIPICGWLLATVLGLVMVPVGVWLMLFGSHLYGQIARKAGGAATLV
jgi:hypothetical protein